MEYHKGDVRTLWIRSPVTYANVVHSTWPSRAMWQTHAPTLNKWHQKMKKNQNKKVTLHMLTHGTMQGCTLTSLVVCIDNKFQDIRERNVTIRSEIWTSKIGSLEFRDSRECVTLWKLILRSLRCTYMIHNCSSNETIRSEIWTTKIRSLGFRDSRECVTLWRLILQSLRCTCMIHNRSPNETSPNPSRAAKNVCLVGSIRY